MPHKNKAYPHVNGLQDTQASCTALPDGSHWLTISTINCLPGRVNIYDSLVGKNVTLDTKVQIARLLHTPLPEITLHVMNIEQQSNGSDCGLYVIATALEVCAGNDPTTGSLCPDFHRSSHKRPGSPQLPLLAQW